MWLRRFFLSDLSRISRSNSPHPYRALRFWLLFCYLFLAGGGLANSVFADELQSPHEEQAVERVMSLREAWRLVESSNPDFISAQAKVRDAQGDIIVAGQKPNPNLALGSTWYQTPNGAGGADIPERFRRYTANNVGISLLVERGGKRGLRQAVAGKGLEATRADLDALTTNLQLQLIQIYFDLAAAERKESLSREYADSYNKSVDAMQLRFKSGDIAAVDLARTEMEAEQAHIQVAENSSDRREIQTALARILGLISDADKLHPRVSWDWDSPPVVAPSSSVDVAKLVETRSDVIAAAARVEQARHAIDLAESLRKSDVTIGAAYDHEPFGNNISQNNVSFNVSIPLQVRYQYRGEISKAYAELDMAQADLAAVRNGAFNEIQKSRDTLVIKSTQMKRLYSGVIPRARETVRAAEFAYEHGASSLTDLLDARRSLQSLLLDVAAARADYVKAQVSWQILAGDKSPILAQ